MLEEFDQPSPSKLVTSEGGLRLLSCCCYRNSIQSVEITGEEQETWGARRKADYSRTHNQGWE